MVFPNKDLSIITFATSIFTSQPLVSATISFLYIVDGQIKFPCQSCLDTRFCYCFQVKLCKTWLLPVKWYVPSRVLREFLSYRIKQIIEDDAAISRDGIGILSDICIRQV